MVRPILVLMRISQLYIVDSRVPLLFLLSSTPCKFVHRCNKIHNTANGKKSFHIQFRDILNQLNNVIRTIYLKVEIFQEHSDTVLTIGLSHLPTNDGIFSVSAIAVGIDVLSENSIESSACTDHFYLGSTLPSELEFVSSIAAHSCAFRFRGAASVSNISTILNMSRASLEAAIAATIFGVSGCLSFSLFVLFSLFMPSSVLTYVPMLGAVAFLQLVLPGMSLALSMTDSDKDNMKRVPPKNDKKVIFGRNEGFMLYSRTLLKAILPALLPQIWHPILYAELMQKVEPVLVASLCPGSPTLINIIQCEELKEYSSNVRLASGCFVLVHFMICIIGASAGYVHRFHSVFEIPPWKNNHTWAFSVVSAVGLVVTYVVKTTAVDMRRALPWYYYCSVIASFFFCIAWVEWWKKSERKLESRAEKLRRLQFETRLGAWSPR